MRDCNLDVAITGIGIVTPAGVGMEAAQSIWRDGKDFFAPITRYPTAGGRVTWGYQITRPDIKVIPDRKAEKILNEKDLSAIVTLMHAVQATGLAPDKINPERFSLFCAAGNTQLADLSPYFAPVKDCVDPIAGLFDSRVFGKRLLELVNPLVVMRTLLNNSLCFGSKFVDARGTNSNYFDFENSGIRAIYEAVYSLCERRTDLAAVTAVSPVLEPFGLNELVEDGICVSTDSDNKSAPRGVPYDMSSQGSTPGEAAVSLMLERLSDAKARGAKIYGVISGVVLGSDANFPATRDFTSQSLLECITDAMAKAGAESKDVAFCIGGGSGYALQDNCELRAIGQYQMSTGHKFPVSSVKGIAGETFEAANLLSIVAAIDTFQTHKTIKNWHLKNPPQEFSQLDLTTESTTPEGNCAIIASRGLFGSTGAVVLRSAESLA